MFWMCQTQFLTALHRENPQNICCYNTVEKNSLLLAIENKKDHACLLSLKFVHLLTLS
jgi:hypothetical protein